MASQLESVTAQEIYDGSDGARTRTYFRDLEARGPKGKVAMNLFRAQKASTRAKRYHGGVRGLGSFRQMAYDRKAWAMENLCVILLEHAAALQITFGWREDPQVVFDDSESWVLYVDLPEIGQVSFHALNRGVGPKYPAEWDKQHQSESRILNYCDRVMAEELPHAQLPLLALG